MHHLSRAHSRSPSQAAGVTAGAFLPRPRRAVPPLLPLLLLLTSLVGCGTGIGTRSALDRAGVLPGADVVRSEIIFGRAKPDGSIVSDAQWQAFLDEHVTPRFPDGLTVIDAAGQYRSRSGQLIQEASKVIILLHDASEQKRASIQDIREIYKRLFDQESVLLISSTSRVSF